MHGNVDPSRQNHTTCSNCPPLTLKSYWLVCTWADFLHKKAQHRRTQASRKLVHYNKTIERPRSIKSLFYFFSTYCDSTGYITMDFVTVKLNSKGCVISKKKFVCPTTTSHHISCNVFIAVFFIWRMAIYFLWGENAVPLLNVERPKWCSIQMSNLL